MSEGGDWELVRSRLMAAGVDPSDFGRFVSPGVDPAVIRRLSILVRQRRSSLTAWSAFTIRWCSRRSCDRWRAAGRRELRSTR